jgi:hypothetical protein
MRAMREWWQINEHFHSTAGPFEIASRPVAGLNIMMMSDYCFKSSPACRVWM